MQFEGKAPDRSRQFSARLADPLYRAAPKSDTGR